MFKSAQNRAKRKQKRVFGSSAPTKFEFLPLFCYNPILMKEMEQSAGIRLEKDSQATKLAVNAVIRATEFSQKFKMQEILKHDIEKTGLFITYFARYCILKDAYEDNWFLKHPTTAVAARLPIVGKLVDIIENYNKISYKAAELLEKAAKIESEEMMRRNSVFMEVNSSEQGENALLQGLSLFQLESAANFMSTAVIEHRKDKSINLKQKIEGIKERYKTV